MRTRLALVLVLICLPFLGCGGGGGGGGGGGTPNPATGLPGTLSALAIQGAAAPGPLAGIFAPLPISPIMDAADGGWVAFVLPVTTPGGTLEVLYVRQPNGTIVEVFVQNDAMPGDLARDILQFHAVWITPSGVVFARVSPTGGPSQSIISATVAGGVATTRRINLEPGDLVPGGGGATWLSFDVASICVTNNNTLWFSGIDNGTVGRLGSVSYDNVTLRTLVSEGAPLPGAFVIVNLITFGVDSTGAVFSFVASMSAGEERLYRGTPGSTIYIELLQEGDILPAATGGGFVDRVWTQGQLLTYSNGAVFVIAEGSVGVTDDVFMRCGGPLDPTTLLRSGAFPPGSPAGQVTDIRMLRMAKSATYPFLFANLTPAALPLTFFIYAFTGIIEPVVFDGRASQRGGNFTATFPGLIQPPYRDVAFDGSVAFLNRTDAGIPGLFWIFRDRGIFTVVLEGDTAPGGGLFGSVTNGIYTVATNVLVFRAPLQSGVSGLFVQG
jgi:hypothetical protein